MLQDRWLQDCWNLAGLLAMFNFYELLFDQVLGGGRT